MSVEFRNKMLEDLTKEGYLNLDSPFYDSLADEFYDTVNSRVDYAYGASKVVLIPENDDEVIKIPFSGTVDDFDEYAEFTGADEEDGWNYCEVEVNITDAAIAEGIGDCFAKTEFIGTVNDYPIYAQEKAVTFYNCKDEDDEIAYPKETTSKTRETCNYNGYYCFNVCWLTDFINYYGEDIFNIFMKFIEDYQIKDLHNDNIGYIGDRPVLIDYSSYND